MNYTLVEIEAPQAENGNNNIISSSELKNQNSKTYISLSLSTHTHKTRRILIVMQSLILLR